MRGLQRPQNKGLKITADLHRRSTGPPLPETSMASFTWDESTLSADCGTLEDMAERFEDTAALMRRLAQEGFAVSQQEGARKIIHSNNEIFKSFGFVIEE